MELFTAVHESGIGTNLPIRVPTVNPKQLTDAEAIEWIRRCPNPHKEDGEIEIRQIFELEDFGASEAVEHHRRLAEQVGKK
jgi:hypothetical protein